MTLASVVAVVGPRRLTREMVIGALLTAGVALLLILIGPAPGDAPAHLYRTLLVRHDALVWDNFWFGGQYPLASYSLLYYLPAALVGNLPLVFGAAVASTALFASIALREWGSAALWPSRVFGVLAAAPLFTGLYSYSLGFATALGALRALQARRTWAGVLLVAVTVGFSPLAFAFLCLVLLAVAASRRRVSWRWVAVGAGVAAAAGVQLAVLLAFAMPGRYPFHAINLVGVLAVSGLGVLLAGRARGGAVLTAFFALWAAGSVVAFVVPSPLGDNWTRLDAFVFPLMLLTASLAEFRPRWLAGVALAGALAYNVVPYVLLVPYRLDGRPAHASFWRPAIAFLRRHSGPNFRVEVVPTAAHWESYWLPAAGFPLARGWYRQLDVADNGPLYRKHLTPATYQSWLRTSAVEYVLVAKTLLDWDGGPAEAAVVRSPGSGLTLAYRSATWSIYRLSHPTPLLTGPAEARVTSFGHTTTRGVVATPGRYLLRVRYTPYWQLRGDGCVRRGADGMTELDLSAAGAFALSVGGPFALVDRAFADDDGGC